MYFLNKIKKEYENDKLIIFVDMDGVIADYEINKPLDFKNKRPIYINIKMFQKLSLIENIELHILSICKKNYQIAEKNQWLDKYASFFINENRTIISKENNPDLTSKELKYNFLKTFVLNNKAEKIMLIDDDNEILKYISRKTDDIILFQDSSIID